MHRVLLFFFLFFSFSFVGYTQKAFRPIKSALKQKNYKEVIDQVNALEKDSLYSSSSKLYMYKIDALRGLNNAENMKIYLKQQYDTVAFFSTTYEIIQQTIKLDSLEYQGVLEGKSKPKYANHVVNLLTTYFPNLHAASRFFYLKRNYAEAMKYLRVCLDVPHLPIGIKSGLSTKHDVSNASLYLISAYKNKDYAEVSRYESLSLQDTLVRSSILECLINTAEAQKEDAKYLHWLNMAWEEYPHTKYFFTKLADFYVAKNDYSQVLKIAEQQLEVDSTDCIASFAKCLAFFNLKRFDECIEEGNHIIENDTTYVDSYYYVGASYVAKGNDITFTDNALSPEYKLSLDKQKKFYRYSQPYLEKYRTLRPSLPKRWAPLLYKIYLSLNEGKKFAEIEKYL